jgi:hypothetical protein
LNCAPRSPEASAKRSGQRPGQASLAAAVSNCANCR